MQIAIGKVWLQKKGGIMVSKSDFSYNIEIKVTAAQIGINKWDWIFANGKSEARAKRLMKKHKFDVLPIKDDKGQFKEYYSTRIWNNYDGLNRNLIDSTTTIYYNTGLRELIKRFNKESRHYYFLTDYEEIVGLVSLANLSCQAVYNYLYYIISGIETSVSSFLQERVSQEFVISEFEKREGTDHYENAIRRFNADSQEHSFYDYLDFKDLALVINKFQKELRGDEKGLLNFYKKFESSYNDLRIKVMHPVRTLLTTHEAISQIDELLDDYSSIMNITNKK
ncbi:hypothetical protein [Roseivirga pacifica]|uniref:hypothetical protein n=1 Tax=Roseivirga pacifica TaxID=1267423 RepID=UPI003BAA5F28